MKLKSVTNLEVKQYLDKVVIVDMGSRIGEVKMIVKKVYKQKTVSGHINLECKWLGENETIQTDTRYVRNL